MTMPTPENPPAFKTLESFEDNLILNGWKRDKDYLDPDRNFFWRRFDTKTRCQLNDSSAGIQIGVKTWRMGGVASIELDLTGEKPDGVWVKITPYALSLKDAESLNTKSLRCSPHGRRCAGSPSATGGASDARMDSRQ
jgi:hypothetical protein